MSPSTAPPLCKLTYHDSICVIQDVVKVVNALLVLHLADDLDVPALLPQHLQHNKESMRKAAHERERERERENLVPLL